MNTFVAPQRTEVDRIEAYLDKAFAPFKFDSIKAAARFQTQLGISVSPEDVELIYTCEALSVEVWTNGSNKPKGSACRQNTQCFRDVLEEMRLDTQRQLNTSVSKLEAEGTTHEQAVLRTLQRAVDPVTLRNEVNQVGYNTCMERSGALIRRKNSVQVRLFVIAAVIVAYALLAVWVIHRNPAFSHPIGSFATYVLLFFGLVGFAYSCPVRRIDADLQSDIDEFVTRQHFSNVSAMQSLRWAVLKTCYLSITKPSSWWLISLLSVLFAAGIASLPALSFLSGLVGAFCFYYAYAFGHSVWAFIDNWARPKTCSATS